MKVKILEENEAFMLEKVVNDWIYNNKEFRIIDIKYSEPEAAPWVIPSIAR